MGAKSRMANTPIGKLSLPAGVLIGGVVSGEDATLPTPETRMAVGDKAIVLTLPELLMDVEEIFAG